MVRKYAQILQMLQAMDAMMYPNDYLVDDGEEEEEEKKKDCKSDN
jgi:hypothetical protein